MKWAGAPEAFGRLSDPHRPVEDAPAPSVNALAALGRLRQAALTGDEAHGELARKTLTAFAGVLKSLGASSAALALAAGAAQNGFTVVLIEGPTDDPRSKALLLAAARVWAPNKLVLRVQAGDQATLRRFGLTPTGAPAKPAAHVVMGKRAVVTTEEPGKLALVFTRR
jgi:uncharacterized protein YyaL (SSP411 family)